MPTEISEKSRGVALGLALPLGVLGVHRFYAGRLGTGVLMALTGGGAAVWWMLDVVRVAKGAFRDGEGRTIRSWGGQVGEGAWVSELEDELDAINDDLDEMARRLELAEEQLGSRAADVPRAGRDPDAPR